MLFNLCSCGSMDFFTQITDLFEPHPISPAEAYANESSELRYICFPSPLSSQQVPIKQHTGSIPSPVFDKGNLKAVLEKSDRLKTGHECHASFIMVLLRGTPRRHSVPNTTVMQLFESFSIEKWVFRLFSINKQGFIHFKPTGSNLDFYYFCWGKYTLVWTYSAAHRSTRAIMFDPGKSNPMFCLLFKHDASFLAQKIETPIVLHWTTLIDVCEAFSATTTRTISKLRSVERLTGHGRNCSNRNWTLPKAKDLSRASQRIGAIVDTLSKSSDLLSMGMDISAYILSFGDTGKKHRGQQPDCGITELDYFRDGAGFIRRLLETRRGTIANYQKRADVQLAIISALINHNDAKASRDLAHQTKKVTEQAHRDALSMKTIAVMTMAFLPGTYTAALWSMPSLDSSLGGDSIWIYWAITLPVTGLVFLVWFWTDSSRHGARAGNGLVKGLGSLAINTFPTGRRENSQDGKDGEIDHESEDSRISDDGDESDGHEVFESEDSDIEMTKRVRKAWARGIRMDRMSDLSDAERGEGRKSF